MKRAFRFLCAVMVLIAAVWSFAAGESALSWRVFNKNENTWIFYPKGLMLFSTQTRMVKPVVIDATRQIDTLFDCIEYEDYLWVSSNAGLYQIDMASQSVERIPLPPSDSAAMGKIAQDADYLWLGTDEQLLRFDKLGREWLSFAYPAAVERSAGIWSSGDEVFCLTNNKLLRFTTSTEKWNHYPLEKPLGTEAVFYPGAGGFKYIDGTTVALYRPALFSWNTINLKAVPQDIFDQDSVIIYNSGSDVVRVNCETSLIRPLNIPNPGAIIRLTATSDTLFMITDKRVAKFSFKQETNDFTEYDQQFSAGECIKVIALNGFILAFTPADIACYDKENRAWKHFPRTGFQQRVDAFTWNAEEFSLRYGHGIQSTLSGKLQSVMEFKSNGSTPTKTKVEYRLDTLDGGKIRQVRDTVVLDSEMLVTFKPPNFRGNLNLHTFDKNDRFADVFFDNSSIVTVPEKGIYYRGNRDDYLNSFRLGTTSNEQVESPLLPLVDMEGGTAIIEGKKRLETRDRKVVRIAGGSGYMTTRTIYKVLQYRADRNYDLKERPDSAQGGAPSSDSARAALSRDTVTVVPGSAEVIVDGEVIDPSLYDLSTSLQTLTFSSKAQIDPVSIISVSYKVKTVPEGGINDIEFIPTHHFGKLHFGAATLSPTDWLSARVGLSGIDRNVINLDEKRGGFDRDKLDPILNVSTPIELRNETMKLMMKATPDFSYNIHNKAKAGSLNLQSRFGASTGLVFNGLFADSRFVSTDTLSRGFGKTRGEYDFKVTHDIMQELPLAYYQHQRFTDGGREDRFALSAGAQFRNLPFLDLSLSRTGFTREDADSVYECVLDSLYRTKDRVRLRLYETTSPFLEKLTRFSKISYDISHAEYRSRYDGDEDWANGRLTTALFTLAPIQRIILSGNVLYRGKMDIPNAPSMDVKPELNLQMIDAPRGTDVSVAYNMKFSRFAQTQMSTDTIVRSVNLTLKPGQWFAPLGWFAPRAKLSQTVNCSFPTLHPSIGNLLSGMHNRTFGSLMRGVGVNLFPTDALLLTNMNEWTRGDTTRSFTSINSFQYLIDSWNTIRADWSSTTDFTFPKHTGTISYDKIWTPWLRTKPMIFTDIYNDRTGNSITAGPRLTANLFLQNVSFIRICSNIHDLKFAWNRENGETDPVPDWSYRFYISLLLKPNIELENDDTFNFTDGAFKDFKTTINMNVYF